MLKVYWPRSLPAFGDFHEGRRQYSTLQVNSVLSPTVFNAFRFSFNRTFQKTDSLPINNLGPEFSFIPGMPFGNMVIAANTAGGGSSLMTELGTSVGHPIDITYNLFEWGNDLNYSKGSHARNEGELRTEVVDRQTICFLKRAIECKTECVEHRGR